MLQIFVPSLGLVQCLRDVCEDLSPDPLNTWVSFFVLFCFNFKSPVISHELEEQRKVDLWSLGK